MLQQLRPTEATLKIGVIQPSNTFTTFSQGAETARVQINANGWRARYAGRIYQSG